MFCPKKKFSTLDVGIGTASLALINRCNDISITGIDIQATLCTIAEQNVLLNNYKKNIHIINTDLQNPQLPLANNSFDYVMSNPPYFLNNSGNLSPYESKIISKYADSEFLKILGKFLYSHVKTKRIC